jgi:serine phosphatase RsbU (regulator of sigma subunit)
MVGKPERAARFTAVSRRHPQVVRRLDWLTHHPRLISLIAAAMIGAVLLLDLRVPVTFWSGLYLMPLTLLAVSMRPRVVAIAAAICLGLSTGIMGSQGMLDLNMGLTLMYGCIAGGALVVLSFLLERVSLYSSYAIARAQMAEATADIIGWARDRTDLDEMLEYALERLGEQVDASSGILLLRDDGEFVGAAGFGLGRDARLLRLRAEAVPAATEALASERALSRDTMTGVGFAGDLAALMHLEQTLVLPMRTFDRDVGVIFVSRPRERGEYREEQVLFAEAVASHIAVSVENVNLMFQLNERRRALELVRDSSFHFAESVETVEILEAVVVRLLNALDMQACDIYELDADAQRLRILVSYDDEQFDQSEYVSTMHSLERSDSSAAAVHLRRPIVINSPDDPRLSGEERELFLRYGHRTQLSVPLRIGEHVVGLVELFDNRASRNLSDEEIDLARTICRFAALAIEKARIYDEQRATAERLDRLSRQLTQLQSFSLELNRSLEIADPDEILEDVARAAVDLVRVRAAAVVAGDAEVLGARTLMAIEGTDRVAIEDDLLERSRRVLAMFERVQGPEAPLPGLTAVDGLLIAPIESDAPVRATALVAADKLEGSFTEADRLLLSTLAAQLGASLHNAIAFQREHAIAETFQTALLMEPPVIPGLEVGVCYKAATDAARVGGDFYDLVSLGPGRLMVMVGDVCGKGLAAAAQSAVVRYMVRAYAADSSPGEALSRLNSSLVTQAPAQPFVTLVLAYIDVTRHQLQYACAGHPRPLVTAGRDVFPVPTEGDLPVGINRGTVYPTNRVVLPDDACVLLYTDGLTDARRGRELFTEPRLRETLVACHQMAAQPLAEEVLGTVAEFAGGVLDDDSAVVIVKMP